MKKKVLCFLFLIMFLFPINVDANEKKDGGNDMSSEKKSKKKTKIIIGILVVFAILVAGISYREYIKAHTFTLSGNEQIQSITGTVKVSSPKDTEVIFIDVKTGVNYAIPYITSGASETIKLEKGKWYSVETGEGLTMSLVNVRIE